MQIVRVHLRIRDEKAAKLDYWTGRKTDMDQRVRRIGNNGERQAVIQDQVKETDKGIDN